MYPLSTVEHELSLVKSHIYSSFSISLLLSPYFLDESKKNPPRILLGEGITEFRR
jgi:hypothetical protein